MQPHFGDKYSPVRKRGFAPRLRQATPSRTYFRRIVRGESARAGQRHECGGSPCRDQADAMDEVATHPCGGSIPRTAAGIGVPSGTSCCILADSVTFSLRGRVREARRTGSLRTARRNILTKRPPMIGGLGCARNLPYSPSITRRIAMSPHLTPACVASCFASWPPGADC